MNYLGVIGANAWVGSIPTWALLFVALLVAYRVTRGGGGAAVSELSKANEVLTSTIKARDEKIHELGAEVRDLRIENEGLKARTDFAAALSPIMDATSAHEERAQQRQEGILRLLDLIAGKLGEENGD